jgi:hypothetical protein
MKKLCFWLIAIGFIFTGCFTLPGYTSLNLEDWLAWKEKLEQINEEDYILQEPVLIDERFNGEFWYHFYNNAGIPVARLFKLNGTSRGRFGGSGFPSVWGVSTREVEIKLVDGHLLTRNIPIILIRGEQSYPKWEDRGIYSFNKDRNMRLLYMERQFDGKWKKDWDYYHLDKSKDYVIGWEIEY